MSGQAKFNFHSRFSFSECNRTYYGNLGVTYGLEIFRPKDDKYPFICELNFTATGGVHGDIIQVSIFCSSFFFCFPPLAGLELVEGMLLLR